MEEPNYHEFTALFFAQALLKADSKVRETLTSWPQGLLAATFWLNPGMPFVDPVNSALLEETKELVRDPETLRTKLAEYDNSYTLRGVFFPLMEEKAFWGSIDEEFGPLPPHSESED